MSSIYHKRQHNIIDNCIIPERTKIYELFYTVTKQIIVVGLPSLAAGRPSSFFLTPHPQQDSQTEQNSQMEKLMVQDKDRLLYELLWQAKQTRRPAEN